MLEVDRFPNDITKRRELLGKMNNELSKKEGCTEIQFKATPMLGSFSVKPISENQYQKGLEKKSYPTRIGVRRPEKKA